MIWDGLGVFLTELIGKRWVLFDGSDVSGCSSSCLFQNTTFCLDWIDIRCPALFLIESIDKRLFVFDDNAVNGCSSLSAFEWAINQLHRLFLFFIAVFGTSGVWCDCVWMTNKVCSSSVVRSSSSSAFSTRIADPSSIGLWTPLAVTRVCLLVMRRSCIFLMVEMESADEKEIPRVVVSHH